MNRTALVLIGMFVAIGGYALVYSGVSRLNPCITPIGKPVGVLTALVPGAMGEASKGQVGELAGTAYDVLGGLAR